MSKRTFLGAALALSLSLTAIPSALAAEPTEGEITANGNTTISIYETSIDPTNVSFEVPLYITMAVVDNQTAVVVPENYGIKNTSPQAEVANGIGIVGMTFSKLAGGGFNTVQGTPTGDKEIKLSIGNVLMPALSAEGTKAVDLTQEHVAGEDNQIQQANGNPVKIAAGETHPLPLKGEVLNTTRTGVDAVAQFKVTYVVSALDAAGKPVGHPYAGSDSEAAGLGKWDDTAGTWQ